MSSMPRGLTTGNRYYARRAIQSLFPVSSDLCPTALFATLYLELIFLKVATNASSFG